MQYDLYEPKAQEVLKLLLKLAGGALLLSEAFYGSLRPVSVLFPAGMLIFGKKAVKTMIDDRREKLKAEFLTEAKLLTDSLRSGRSVENAVCESKEELRELYTEKSDMVREVQRMELLFRFNVTAEEVFRDFAARSGTDEIRDFAEVFSLVKRNGGQIGEALMLVTANLSESFKTEEEIRMMISSKKAELHLMDLMPAGILLYVKAASPDLLTVMYTTGIGRLVMTVCLIVYGAAYLWGESLTDIRL